MNLIAVSTQPTASERRRDRPKKLTNVAEAAKQLSCDDVWQSMKAEKHRYLRESYANDPHTTQNDNTEPSVFELALILAAAARACHGRLCQRLWMKIRKRGKSFLLTLCVVFVGRAHFSISSSSSCPEKKKLSSSHTGEKRNDDDSTGSDQFRWDAASALELARKNKMKKLLKLTACHNTLLSAAANWPHSRFWFSLFLCHCC